MGQKSHVGPGMGLAESSLVLILGHLDVWSSGPSVELPHLLVYQHSQPVYLSCRYETELPANLNSPTFFLP